MSFTLPQVTAPLATWAIKNGITKVYTLVSDFGPGIDAETQFKKTFTAAGGQIVGEVNDGDIERIGLLMTGSEVSTEAP